VPLVVAGAVAAGVALSTAGTSSASPSLPPRSAAQLLVAVQRSTTTMLSGTIHENMNLGLPRLPDDQSPASLSVQSLLAGSHTARVWVDGPDRQRLALVGQLSEADVVHNGRDLWTYVSESNSVSHTVLPRSSDVGAVPNMTAYTPTQLANRLLKAITPSTSVTVDPTRTVAGRPAYTLVLRPRDARSTVREVRIAVDASRSVPLRVQLFGAASSPAFQTGFTRISFAKPSARTFRFTKPAGATVSTNPLGPPRVHRLVKGVGIARGTAAEPAHSTSTPSKIIGTGWTSVVEVGDQVAAGMSGGMLNDLSTAVGTSGQRLLHTALLNAVFRPDGKVFVGAVSPAVLEHVAATTR
jgi:outer membrane lipoprotein-sorting protein